jgi:hypothetical protein
VVEASRLIWERGAVPPEPTRGAGRNG